MALVKCPDCGKMVSERACSCLACGCPAEFFGKEKIEKEEDLDLSEAVSFINVTITDKEIQMNKEASEKSLLDRETKMLESPKVINPNMFCPHCGKKILRTARFCNFCGKQNNYNK